MHPRLILAATVLSLAFSAVAAAQTPTRLGTFRDWSAYTFSDSNGKVCYAATQPRESLPAGVNRDPVFFMISTRPAESVANEASVMIGYPIRENSTVSAEIDGRSFTMFVRDDGAWVENPTDEAALVAAMRAGRSMIIKGVSRRGTNTTDTFSLAGVTAALDSVATECPAPR